MNAEALRPISTQERSESKAETYKDKIAALLYDVPTDIRSIFYGASGLAKLKRTELVSVLSDLHTLSIEYFRTEPEQYLAAKKALDRLATDSEFARQQSRNQGEVVLAPVFHMLETIRNKNAEHTAAAEIDNTRDDILSDPDFLINEQTQVSVLETKLAAFLETQQIEKKFGSLEFKLSQQFEALIAKASLLEEQRGANTLNDHEIENYIRMRKLLGRSIVEFVKRHPEINSAA